MIPSDAFLRQLPIEAAKIGTAPDTLLRVWYLESTLNPHVGKPTSTFLGLNQINRAYLAQYGVDANVYYTFTDAQQLPVVMADVRDRMKMYNRGNPFPDAATYYVANILPGKLSAIASGDPNAVIMDSESTDARERTFYTKNKGLDIDKSGKITLSDIQKHMARIAAIGEYKRVIARLNAVAGTSPSSGAGIGALFLLGVGGLALVLSRKR